ncbi:MAG TPA: type II and III secretion system protein [Pyrinomonadaceae bacterium]|nr:type II and III secretion system protein [Pyrinomonadaceae bacterium]
MKRIKRLTLIALTALIAVSFFCQYAIVTATAPGVRDDHGTGTKPSGNVRALGGYQLNFGKDERRPQPKVKTSANTVIGDGTTGLAAVDVKIPNAAPVNGNINLSTSNVAPRSRPAAASDGSYCDPNFVGEPIVFNQMVDLTLDDLVTQIHNRFGVNFLMGPKVRQHPINIKSGAIPWNVLLRSQLFVSGIRAKCINTNTIELVDNNDLPRLQDSADVVTKFVKLKFLQRTSGGTVDLAGRSNGGGQNGGQGGCGGSSQGTSGGGGISGGGGVTGGQQGQTVAQQQSSRFDKLIIEIEKILGIRSMTESSAGQGGATGGQTEERRTNRFVTQIPGRNILVIRATEEEFALIDQIIQRADRPPFQVVVKGLVYTADQNRLRDIGVQTSITGGTADNRTNGSVTGHTLGGSGTLFDFSTILGTFDFNVQATALQENGIISIKSRPFATVIDGLCTTLNVGRELPIVIDSTLGGQGDVVFVNAANNLAVTPYVIDDENGNPMAVTLDLRLTANDVDSSVTARGVPAISERSIQTQLLLNEDKTAILGGFTVDSDSKTIQKTPGIGDIPIIGELFKRRIRDTRLNRLYFAISVDVVPYGEVIEPVKVPGATTDPPSLTPKMLDRSTKAEPKQVVPPKPDH